MLTKIIMYVIKIDRIKTIYKHINLKNYENKR